VLVPDSDFMRRFASQQGIGVDLAVPYTDPGLTKAIGAAVARVNQTLGPGERVRRFVIASEPFSIANGQMTPTLKIKRHAIRDAYGAALDALYHAKEIAA